MPLINFQTDLTSLPWGRDRRESGDSKEPYIRQDIPEGITYDDMPGRGIGDEFFTTTGFLRPRAALRDVSRLTQMFFDFSSPRGLLFVAKENILSRTSVKTQAGGPGYGGFKAGTDGNTFTAEGDILKLSTGGGVSQGIYLPTLTILQALGPVAGGHLNLLGIDPTQPLSGPGGIGGEGGGIFGDTKLGLMTYSSRANQRSNTDDFEDSNRLIRLTDFHVNQPLEFRQQEDLAGDPIVDNDGNPVEALENTIRPNLYSYSGGPGSILGIGNTNLMFASERTGYENRLAASNNGYFFQGGVKNRSYQIDSSQSKLYYDLPYVNNSATAMYGQRILSKVFRQQSQRQFLFKDSSNPNVNSAIAIGPNGPYQTFPTQVSGLITERNDDGTPSQTVFKTNRQILYKNKSRTYDQLQLISKDGVIQGDGLGLYPQDFRRQLYTASTEFVPAPTEDPNNPLVGGTQQSTVLSVSPNYRTKNIDVRLNMGQPGLQGGAKRGETDKTDDC